MLTKKPVTFASTPIACNEVHARPQLIPPGNTQGGLGKHLGQLVVLLAFASGFTSAAHADLIGSTVTGHIEVPNRGDVASNTVSAVVGSGVEFPDGIFYSISLPYAAVPVTIDVQADDILATIDQTEFTAPGTFNGYIFDFSGLDTPILNAYLDPVSSFTPAQGIVGFTSTEVTYSDPSLLVPVNSVIKIDVEFAPQATATTPEPSTFVLLFTGAAGLAGALRKKRWRVVHP